MQASAILDLTARVMNHLLGKDGFLSVVYSNPEICSRPNINIQVTCCDRPYSEGLECIDAGAAGYGFSSSLTSIPTKDWQIYCLRCQHKSLNYKCTIVTHELCDKLSLWTLAGRLMPTTLDPKWPVRTTLSYEAFVTDSTCFICHSDEDDISGFLCSDTKCLNIAQWFVGAVYFTSCCDLVADIRAYIAQLSALALIKEYQSLIAGK